MDSRSPVLSAICSLSLSLAVACGDSGGATDSSTGSSTTASSTTDSSSGSSTDTTGSTSDPTTTATASTTTDDPTTGPGTSSSTTTPVTSSTTTTTTTTDTTTGPDIDCAALPMGPFTPEELGSGYDGSEDLGFDGAGGLAMKGGDDVVIVTSDLNDTPLAMGFPQVYGTRFATNGDLLVLLPQQGVMQAISPMGTVTDVAVDLDGPNGLYVDPSGALWVTEFGGSRVTHFTPDYTPTTVFEGPQAQSANGVVYDPDRGLLFFTNYGAGRLYKLAVDANGQTNEEPVEIVQIQGANLDGLVEDACGNIYAVDQGNSRLFRVWLDEAAQIVGAPEELAEFDDNVANAQFGWGTGWEPDSLYVAGNPGTLYKLAVGVQGAPIGLVN